MVSGPEIARMIQEFERSNMVREGENLCHYESVPGVQKAFSLVSTFEEIGNAFEEDSEELLVLDTKGIMDTAVVETAKKVIKIGQDQYREFVKERFQDRCKPITEPINKNSLPLLSSRVEKYPSKQKAQVTALKNDCAYWSGSLAVLVQKLSPGTATTFQEYAGNVFIAYVVKQLQTANRIDVIWRVYQPDSLKKATREKRGTATRRTVTPFSRIPGNWKIFLQVDENKTEPFAFLAQQVERTRVDDKELYSTCGQSVLNSPPREDTSNIAPCTRKLIHGYCYML